MRPCDHVHYGEVPREGRGRWEKPLPQEQQFANTDVKIKAVKMECHPLLSER